MKQWFGWAASWILYGIGDVASWILELFGNSILWAAFWYPTYNNLMLWSCNVQEWSEIDDGPWEL